MNARRRWAAGLAQRSGWLKLRERLGTAELGAREVGSWLGGAALWLALVLIVSGAALTIHYRPAADEAHSSVLQLSGSIAFGALVRGIHFWSAQLLVVALGAYVFSLLVRGQHGPPGELQWIVAVALLGLTLGLAFTGSVLPWSQAAQAHARVGGQLLAELPLGGSYLKRVLLGADHVAGTTAARIFALHVAVLPVAAAVITVGYLLCRWAREPAAREANAARRTIPFFPDGLTRQAALGTGLLLLVATLASTVPPEAGESGSLAAPTPIGVRPAWYFAAVHVVLSAAPARLLGWRATAFLAVVALVMLILILALPWLDPRGSKGLRYAAWVLVACWLLLSVYGVLA